MYIESTQLVLGVSFLALNENLTSIYFSNSKWNNISKCMISLIIWNCENQIDILKTGEQYNNNNNKIDSITSRTHAWTPPSVQNNKHLPMNSKCHIKWIETFQQSIKSGTSLFFSPEHCADDANCKLWNQYICKYLSIWSRKLISATMTVSDIEWPTGKLCMRVYSTRLDSYDSYVWIRQHFEWAHISI